MVHHHLAVHRLAYLYLVLVIVVFIESFDNHYYDEDDIKVSKMPAGTRASISTFQPVELTEEEKKAAREAAIKRLTEEQYVSLRKKTSRARKGATEVQQMSLF